MNRGASHNRASCRFRCLFRLNPIAAGMAKRPRNCRRGISENAIRAISWSGPQKGTLLFSLYPAPPAPWGPGEGIFLIRKSSLRKGVHYDVWAPVKAEKPSPDSRPGGSRGIRVPPAVSALSAGLSEYPNGDACKKPRSLSVRAFFFLIAVKPRFASAFITG